MAGLRETRSGIAFFCSLIGAAGLFAQEPARPLPLPAPIRVTVEEIGLSVTVTNSSGNFIKRLHRDDFQVFDNGKERNIIGFNSEDEPASVVLVLESGPAAFLNRKSEIEAADLLLRSLARQDRVAIISYSRTPLLVLDFTSNKNEARAALAGFNFMNGFGELNLVASVLATIDWLRPLPGKKTIIVLSSGVDTTPQLDWPRAQQMIESSDVRILAVSVSEEIRKPAKGAKPSSDQREDRKLVKSNFAAADRTLRQIAEPTGGRAYFPKSHKDFDRAFTDILHSVGYEYRLTITPSPPYGQVHALEVKVAGLWRKANFRKAYFIPLTGSN